MRKRVFIALFMAGAVLSGIVFTFSWPFKDPQITIGYASLQDGEFFRGVEMEGEGVVSAVQSGKLVYFSSRSTDFPHPLGSFAAVLDDQGYISIYGNLDSLLPVQADIEAGDAIALANKSLYFEILDSNSGWTVNTPRTLQRLESSAQPRIEGLNFLGSDERVVADEAITRISPGLYQVEISTYTELPGAVRIPPAKISLFSNSELVRVLEVGNIRSSKDGAELSLGPGMWSSSDELLSDAEVFLLGSISVPPGESNIEVRVQDYYGRERSLRRVLVAE
jgi:hypothetical protein